MIPGGSPKQVILLHFHDFLLFYVDLLLSCGVDVLHTGRKKMHAEVQPRHHDFEGGPQQILGISCFKAHSPDLTPLLRCVTLPALCPHPEILQIQCGKAAKPRRNAHCPLIITPNGHSVWFSTAQLVYPMVYSIVYHIAAGWPLGKSLTVTSFIDRIGDGGPPIQNCGILVFPTQTWISHQNFCMPD